MKEPLSINTVDLLIKTIFEVASARGSSVQKVATLFDRCKETNNPDGADAIREFAGWIGEPACQPCNTCGYVACKCPTTTA
jgi:hypothetical protein